MIKRFSIALLFFSAFAVMMAHTLILHHHDEDGQTTKHHYKDHGDDNDLGNLFSHFQHIGVNNQFVSTHRLPVVKQIDILRADISFITAYNFYFSYTEQPPPVYFPDPPDILSSLGSSAFCLRGPPAFTV